MRLPVVLSVVAAVFSPMVLSTALAPLADWQGRWQACHAQRDSLRRLVCYDAMAELISSTASTASTAAHSAVWQAIEALAGRRDNSDAAFVLHQGSALGELTLIRSAIQGGVLAISCANHITQVRIRLDDRWSTRMVTTRLDQGAPLAESWFVRDDGYLLESGRGLPAIDMLKQWRDHSTLWLQGADRTLQLDLTGLAEALKPLRQQCRW